MRRLLPLLVVALLLSCQRRPPPAAPAAPPAPPAPASLAEACANIVGAPRIEQVAPRVWVALGYDLANVILVRTSEGNVIIDAAMSPARARPIRDALLRASPGPIRMVILTHNHLDHSGGASVFADPGAPVWASHLFQDEFLRQYGLSRRTELRRGERQFGVHVPPEELPCSAIGRRLDPAAQEEARHSGARMPTRTVTGHERVVLGGVTFDLYEAPGETADQLFVHLPDERVLMPGDNFYWAFPNLYTLRGGPARPISGWIESLDRMRALAAEAIVPSHTLPLRGGAVVAAALRDYRDAIQWVRDEALRGAAAEEPLEALAARVRLPAHLRASPYLQERYGQVDWSVRAIYQSQVGWFDGQAERLYPLPEARAAQREIEALGGAQAVLQRAEAALAAGGDEDLRWGLHLLAKLRTSAGRDNLDSALAERERALWVAGYQRLGRAAQNSNGRAYLLSRARELATGAAPQARAQPDEVLLRSLPLRIFFQGMAPLLKPGDASTPDEESASFALPDEGARFTVTLRRGVAEIIEGPPLPGTPPPLVQVTVRGMTWRQLALRLTSPVKALASGDLKVEGSLRELSRFLGRFDTDQ